MSAERFYLAQLLWDDAMAESLVNFRARFPTPRVMLIVGVFHVAHEGGTYTKLRQRRPDDRVVTIVYGSTTDGTFPFQDEDRHAGDIVIYGISPPPKKSEAKRMPPMVTAPTTQPSSAPAEAPATSSAPAATQPTSGPAQDEAPSSAPAHP